MANKILNFNYNLHLINEYFQEEKQATKEQLEAYHQQNQQLNEEILELHGRRKCELQTMHSSFRRTSEHSDASLIDSFIEVRFEFFAFFCDFQISLFGSSGVFLI